MHIWCTIATMKKNLPVECNHYEFVASVGKAWIDPINYWLTCHWLHLNHLVKIKPPSMKLKGGKQCSPFTNKWLCPVTSLLQNRCALKLNYLPKTVEKKNKNPTSWSALKVAPKGMHKNINQRGSCLVWHIFLFVRSIYAWIVSIFSIRMICHRQ